MLKEGFEPIPGYRLLNFLGRGQFGEVWRSTSPGGTHVALKFLNVREQQGRTEFRAIQKVKGIRYPHLALTYALWLLDDNLQVIEDAAFDRNQTLMKESMGGTLILQAPEESESREASMLVIATVLCERNLMERLRDCIQNGERGIPVPELIGYIEDAAKAIDFLNSPRHELGDGPVAIHHCDIKPENIMILGDLAVVSDFGVARILGSGTKSRANTMGGSVAYAAPETFDNRTESSSDQYSLAVTYYELRTGKLPFPKESQMQVICDKLAGKLDFSDVSASEIIALERATALEPTDRFPSSRAFVDALRQAVGVPIPSPKVRLPFAAIVLGLATILVSIASIAWYMKNANPEVATGKQATLPNEMEVDIVVSPGETEAITTRDIEPIVAPKSLTPIKPFLVSIDGNGTHDSIARAIADSATGETIKIRSGTYRESIVIDRSIKLVGVGGGVARVVTSEDTCIKILGASQVYIENLTIDSQSSNFSAIDIVAGRLVLTRCNAFASSMKSDTCVKARAKAIFVAEKCKFQTTMQTAVFGEENSAVTIRDSDFSFAGLGINRIGIQGFGAKGLIQRCRFTGPCSFGIDWKDNPEELRIESCRFDNCEIAIQTTACKAVSINGTVEQPCEIKNADCGLYFKQSRVGLSKVNMDGGGQRNKVAIRITKESEVKCTDSSIVGYASGILVSQSAITVDNVTIRETSLAGMLVDGGIVDGNRLSLLDSTRYGLMVLNKGSSAQLSSLEVRGSKKHEFTIPVYVASGRVEFKAGVFSDCLCGVFVDPSQSILNDADLAEKRSLAELMEQPWGSNVTGTAIEVLSDRMTLNDCKLAWFFNGVGSARIKQIDGNLPKGNRVPKLGAELELDGLDLTDFAVIDKKRDK